MRLSLLPTRRAWQLFYAPLLAMAMGLMMLRVLVMARVLDVHAFAEFSGGLLISGTFCMVGCLGLQPMLQREWPMNLVRHQELRGLVRAAQCNIVAVVCALLGLLGAAVGMSPAGMTPGILAIGMLHGLSQQLFLIATVESRSRGDVFRFALQNFLRAVAALTLSSAAAFWLGSAEFALAIDAVVTIALSLSFFQSSLGRVRRSAAEVFRLAARRLRVVRWDSALTMMLIMAAGFGLLNADRWVASDRLDSEDFARYAFAWIVLSIAQSIQVVINASVYPLLARRFAEHGREVAFRLCLRVSASILVAGSIAAVPLCLMLGYGVRRWFPQYSEVQALFPLFLATGVLRAADFWSSFLLIAGLELRLLMLNLCAMAFGLMVWTLLMRPWAAGVITLQDVGWLAAFLSLSAFLAAAGASWSLRRG